MPRSRVRWHQEASRDVERLYDFLYEKSPEAAARAATTILEAEDLLKSSPRLGRAMADGSRRRELLLHFGSGAYVVRYVLEEESTIVILRVWHSREQRPSD